MNGDFSIIPVRDFSFAKLRLRNDLSGEERAKLASTLLERVVRTSEASGVEQIVVVASNPAEVISFLKETSRVSVISEKEHHGGVNSAMRVGIDYANQNGAKRIAMYPSDLPLISHAKIDKAFSLLDKHDVILNPSAKKDGTNLLAMSSTLPFDLHYDDDSFTKHSSEARARGLNLLVLDWTEFSNDLDDATDLDKAMAIYKSKGFEDLLRGISQNEVSLR